MRKLSITVTVAIALIVSAGFGQEEASSAITGTIRATVDYGPVPRAPSNSASLPVQDVDAAWEEIEKSWRKEVPRAGIVGSSLMLVHRGKILAQAFEGYADLATQRPVDARTIYHWASCTKTFTGIALMQLIERGRLALGDPIVKFLPELRACHDPHGAIEEITVEHPLSHSAGFRGRTWPWGGAPQLRSQARNSVSSSS